ncbi:MAG: hypothetical protein Q8P41_10265 [Pseudomonadota bacterium]|nr:hypothetical protein [Pseudomonadota bacterium]
MMFLLASLAFACPNIDAEVERATAALVGGDFAKAKTALEAAESSFQCARATPTQLGRYWLVEGASAHLRKDTATARASFAAARATAPDLYDDRLGPDVRAAWAAARPDGDGSLFLEPTRDALIDGTNVSVWPANVTAAPHLVQVVGADGGVRFGRVVRIGRGEDAVVDTGVLVEPTTNADTSLAEARPVIEPERKKSPAMLILAGVAAAGAGACAGGAVAQNHEMTVATDRDTLTSSFDRQKVFHYSTYGLAGAAAVAFTLHFVIP